MSPKTTTGEAAYQVVARDLRASILQGDFADGQRLPTEAELATKYEVSRQTVRRAFHDLVSEGMVYRVPGRGTFPAERSSRYLRQFGSIDDLMNLSVDTTMRVVEPMQRKVDIEAAGRLQLPSDTVHTISLLRVNDEQPFCHTRAWMPPSVADLLTDVTVLQRADAIGRSTLIGLIDERIGRPIVAADQSITATAASDRIAEVLDCDPGAPVLRIDRLYEDMDGVPVELAVSHFLPEAYSYRVRLTRSHR